MVYKFLVAACFIGSLLALSCLPATGESELSWDDGMQDGKLSAAGGGHAVRFTAPPGKNSLAQVKIYSMRYGRPNDSHDYSIYILDLSLTEITRIDGNYQDFPYAQEGWKTIDLDPPVKVPKDFWVSFVFNPAQNYGVYVYYDKNNGGHSRQGTPLTSLQKDPGYEWMIRAVVE